MSTRSGFGESLLLVRWSGLGRLRLPAYWHSHRPTIPHLADIGLSLDALFFAPIVITVAFETASFCSPCRGPALPMTIPADFNIRNIYIGR